MVSTRDMTNFFVSDALQQEILYHVDMASPLKNLTGKRQQECKMTAVGSLLAVRPSS